MVNELLGGLPRDSCYLQQRAACGLLPAMAEATHGPLHNPEAQMGSLGLHLSRPAS